MYIKSSLYGDKIMLYYKAHSVEQVRARYTHTDIDYIKEISTEEFLLDSLSCDTHLWIVDLMRLRDMSN
jgi:hypothetical protein